MLRDRRRDSSSSFGGWGDASRANWSQLAGYFDERIVDLAKQKSELTPQERLAERATLSRETEARLLCSLFIFIQILTPFVARTGGCSIKQY